MKGGRMEGGREGGEGREGDREGRRIGVHAGKGRDSAYYMYM